MNSYTNLVTLTFETIHSQQQHEEAKGDFTLLISSIQTACKFISTKVRKAGMANLYGTSGGINVTGDVQKKLDVLANEVFINSLKSSQQVSVILSEEEENPIILNENAKYIVAFDPLDGSSNIDANVTIGSIFGIWKKKSQKNLQKEDLLQRGSDLVASGYCVYGSSTQLITCIDKIVNGYTLDPSLGEFILTHPNLKMPSNTPTYSINEGNSIYWDFSITEFIKRKKGFYGGKPYSLRYIGSMVADVHRTLLYGGIFMYPKDSKSPDGKLRLMYECNPLSLIIEAAGGLASTGKQRILSIEPSDTHQKCAVIMGNAKDVEEIEQLYLNNN
jgi:fructose-1,6-bisphosphatase I